MRSLLYVLTLVIAMIGWSQTAFTQTIDPYRRLTDPRAITYLDGDDVEPLRYHTGVAWPAERDTGRSSSVAHGVSLIAGATI